MSKDKFTEQYLYGKKQRISRNMHYGSLMADGLKDEEATGDPVLDLMMSKIPKFERMDMPVVDIKNGVDVVNPHDGKKYKVPILTNDNDPIPLLALPDTSKSDYSAFKEYKTSVQKWTQKRVDDSGQITFYVTAIWIVTGKIPQDIELVNIEVDYDQDGRLFPTGNMYQFKTKRSLVDVIKMTKRIRHAWSGIKELSEKELLI